MSVRFSALLVVGFLTTSPHCFGREVDQVIDQSLDPSLNREQWQQRERRCAPGSGEFITSLRARLEHPMTSGGRGCRPRIERCDPATERRVLNRQRLRCFRGPRRTTRSARPSANSPRAFTARWSLRPESHGSISHTVNKKGPDRDGGRTHPIPARPNKI